MSSLDDLSHRLVEAGHVLTMDIEQVPLQGHTGRLGIFIVTGYEDDFRLGLDLPLPTPYLSTLLR